MPGLGDKPIEPRFRELMNKLAPALDELFNGDERPKKTGFVLIVFPFEESAKAHRGETGRANYISNAQRADVVVMLKEQIKRFEGQPEMQGRA